MLLLFVQLTKENILLLFCKSTKLYCHCCSGRVKVNGAVSHSSLKYTISTIVVLAT